MKVGQRLDVDVGNAVAIGQAERVAQMIGDAPQPPAGHRFRSGIDKRHAPGFGLVRMEQRVTRCHVVGDVRRMQDVVGEIFLDHIAAIAKADHEIGEAVMAVDLHDMPEDGTTAYLDHRLWAQMALFRNPGTVPACENDNFHALVLLGERTT
ncbi:hypothetical protein D3C72_1578660 [compost metagenome]